MNVAVEEKVLRIERLIPAPPQRVFDLWTDPAKIVQWWGPEGFDLPAHAFDIRPGGQWRTTMRTPEGTHHTVSGVYRVIDPPSRLVFSWAWDNDKGERGHETEVTVTFEAAPGGTRLLLLQREFQNVESFDGHTKGWTATLGKLARIAG